MADPLLVLPVAQPVRPAEKTKALTAVVKATQAMLAAGAARFAPKGPGAKELAPPLVSLLSDRVTLAIELPPDLPSGDYELDLDVKTGKSTAPIANTVALVFRVIK